MHHTTGPVRRSVAFPPATSPTGSYLMPMKHMLLSQGLYPHLLWELAFPCLLALRISSRFGRLAFTPTVCPRCFPQLFYSIGYFFPPPPQVFLIRNRGFQLYRVSDSPSQQGSPTRPLCWAISTLIYVPSPAFSLDLALVRHSRGDLRIDSPPVSY